MKRILVFYQYETRFIFYDDELDILEDEDDENDTDELSNHDYSESSSDSELDASSWSSETILRQAGYTVAKKYNLSDSERHEIINKVIRNREMTKWEIINHLRFMVSLRHGKPEFSEAINKWEQDISYLLNQYR